MKPVTVYYDYASPWSYCAFELAEKRMPGVKLDWVPIYIRGLPGFAAGMPYTPGKLIYLAQDLLRVTQHEGIAFSQPAAFPIDGIHALRAALIAKDHSEAAFERFHGAAFRGTWAESIDIADKTMVAMMLRSAIGSTATDEQVASFSQQRIKDRLRRNTEDAVARGVFGLPTFYVDNEQFWGHDRMDYVLRAAKKSA